MKNTELAGSEKGRSEGLPADSEEAGGLQELAGDAEEEPGDLEGNSDLAISDELL